MRENILFGESVISTIKCQINCPYFLHH